MAISNSMHIQSHIYIYIYIGDLDKYPKMAPHIFHGGDLDNPVSPALVDQGDPLVAWIASCSGAGGETTTGLPTQVSVVPWK